MVSLCQTHKCAEQALVYKQQPGQPLCHHEVLFKTFLAGWAQPYGPSLLYRETVMQSKPPTLSHQPFPKGAVALTLMYSVRLDRSSSLLFCHPPFLPPSPPLPFLSSPLSLPPLPLSSLLRVQLMSPSFCLVMQ